MSIIAVDFDGTIVENAWPEIGEAKEEIIAELLARQAVGDKIILWTCREGRALDEALEWCQENGLTFDAVNENMPYSIDRFGKDCRKVWADEYWDDKAVQK